MLYTPRYSVLCFYVSNLPGPLCWNQPTNQPRYRLQDGLWPNHKKWGLRQCWVFIFGATSFWRVNRRVQYPIRYFPKFWLYLFLMDLHKKSIIFQLLLNTQFRASREFLGFFSDFPPNAVMRENFQGCFDLMYNCMICGWNVSQICMFLECFPTFF